MAGRLFDDSLGLLNYELLTLSDNIRNKLCDRILDITNKCRILTSSLIEKHKDKIEKISSLLLSNKTILLNDIKQLVENELMNSLEVAFLYKYI